MRRAGLVLALTVGTVLAPLTAAGQPAGKVARVGFLRAGQPPKTFVEGFQQGLLERGYVEGQNLLVEYRFTDGSLEPLTGLAEELVRRKVDVILASAAPAALAARKVTTTVPIVFVAVVDPVEQPANPTNALQLKGAEAAARVLGVQLQSLPVQGPDDFEPAFAAARGVGGLLQVDNVLFTTHRTRLTELAARSRLPAIYGYRELVEVGGLMSYGADLPDLYRRAATYLDKILKGTRPGDLPVEPPTKFELVVNLKAAKAIGLTIPQSLLLRADEAFQ